MEVCEYLRTTCNLRSSTREIRDPYLQSETGQLHYIKGKKNLTTRTFSRKKQSRRCILKTVKAAVTELLRLQLNERFACSAWVKEIKEPGS